MRPYHAAPRQATFSCGGSLHLPQFLTPPVDALLTPPALTAWARSAPCHPPSGRLALLTWLGLWHWCPAQALPWAGSCLPLPAQVNAPYQAIPSSSPMGTLSCSKPSLGVTTPPHPDLPSSAHLKAVGASQWGTGRPQRPQCLFGAELTVVVETAGVCCSQQTISPAGKAHLVPLHHQHLESPSLAHGSLGEGSGSWGGARRRPQETPYLTMYSGAHAHRWWSAALPKKSGSCPGDGIYGVLKVCLP